MRLKARHAQKNHCTDCGRYARREDALKNALCHTEAVYHRILPVYIHPGFQNRFLHCTAAGGAGEFQSEYF